MTNPSDAIDHLRRWRYEAVKILARHDGPVPVDPGPKLVLHVVPLYSFLTPDPPDALERLPKPVLRDLIDVVATGVLHLPDSTVALLGPPGIGTWRSFRRFYRCGAIEDLDMGVLGAGTYPSAGLENTLLRKATSYLDLLRSYGGPPPYAVTVSLLEVRGLALSEMPRRPECMSIAQENILAPEVLIEQYTLGDQTSVDRAMMPALDFIWNQFGLERDPHYTGAGGWTSVW